MSIIHAAALALQGRVVKPLLTFHSQYRFNSEAMKTSLSPSQMIRSAAVTAIVLLVQPASATELSPWMGSDDQSPFQLDPVTMVAVTFAADPLQTGSLTKAPCQPTGCTLAPKPAIEIPTASGSPQN
jgi:hypothetical protein